MGFWKRRRAIVGPRSYMLGVGAAWISVHAAFLIYMITPLVFIVPPQSHGTRWTGSPAEQAAD
jgi:hypothetical protein